MSKHALEQALVVGVGVVEQDCAQVRREYFALVQSATCQSDAPPHDLQPTSLVISDQPRDQLFVQQSGHFLCALRVGDLHCI